MDASQWADPLWRLSNLYSIVTDEGKEVRFKPNEEQVSFYKELHNRNIICKARQLGFCVAPETRVLNEDREWVRIDSLRAGDRVVAVDEFPTGGKGGNRKVRIATVEKAGVIRAKAYRITFEDGRTVVCTDRHPWLAASETQTQGKWASISGEGNAVERRLLFGHYVRSVARPDTEDEVWAGSKLPGGWVRITGMEELGEQDMIDLQTSEKTYIAEGFVSHNTTFLAIIALDQCLFVSNYTACIIAHTLPDAKKIFRNKIKRVYDALPEAIRDLCPLKKEAAEELVFDNGSSISVATSSRGGTTQFLHVSEMGKISRVYPERAKEIVTGAFESVPADGIIVVESTAEGQDGWFYEACMLAERKRVERQELTRLDFKLHFYPWQNKSAYAMSKEEAARVYLTDKDRQYFADLQSKHGISLTQEQKAWWVKKRDTLMENMGREYPSTLEESFAVALEGAIYQQQMTMLRNANRIGVCPVRAGVAVDSYWDFGVDDSTTIWLRQRVGGLHRFVRYFEASGEGLTYYWELLERWREEKGMRFNRHYIPHDGEQRIQGYEVTTRKAMLLELGMRNIVTVPRVARLQIGIDAVRAILPECEFDAEGCGQGIKCLDYYSREWDDNRATWSSNPKHDKWSHGADAFRQFAQSLKLDAQDMPISTGVYLGGY